MSETSVKEKFATSAIDDSKRPRRRRWKALGFRILVVAAEGYAKDWSAYIGIVRGTKYDEEWKEVLDNGDKIEQKLAEFLFPDFASTLEWRD